MTHNQGVHGSSPCGTTFLVQNFICEKFIPTGARAEYREAQVGPLFNKLLEIGFIYLYLTLLTSKARLKYQIDFGKIDYHLTLNKQLLFMFVVYADVVKKLYIS